MAANRDPFSTLDPDEVRDLGFGEAVARDPRNRLLNRDGTFNAGRHGLPRLRSVPVYEHLATISWSKFYVLALVAYFVVDVLFALIYVGLGPEALNGTTASSTVGRFAEAFFFSVHTSTTVGYGSLAPATIAANLVAAVEAFIGLGGFAVMAALLFARFSRPTADIRFSDHAIVGPYRGGDGFMFRIANASRGSLADASVRVIFSWLDGEGSLRRRRFETLDLERRHVTFFPMHWTVVHPLDGNSPLHGWDAARLDATHAEFLIQVAATVEIYS
jgi:inward rectifier potassium channel